MTFRVAITGGVGSGKSTVANMFAQLGVVVIDTDQLAHKLCHTNSAIIDQIAHLFGNQILDEGGKLKRDKLRDIIFSDLAAKKNLEEILHPPIIAAMETIIAQVTDDYCISIVPLLFEIELDKRFDRVLLIDLPVEIQIERTVKRDKFNEKLVMKIINTQMARELRQKKSDDIILNVINHTLLEQEVLALHHRYQQLAQHH